MPNSISLLELFPDLGYSEAARELLAQNKILDADLRPDEREVSVCVHSEVYLPASLLRQTEEEACKAYLLRRVDLSARYPEDLLSKVDFGDVADRIRDVFPMATPILSGCQWEVEGRTVHLRLKANGVEDVRPWLRFGEEFLSEAFDAPIHIEIHSGRELNREELFAETARIREQAVEAIPLPRAQEAAPASGGSAAPSMPADLIYGKPFSQSVIPMKEVTLDTFKACVEGEVFQVNHRELSGGKNIVVSFYMTDHSGAICVNKFMSASEARPVVDAIHEPNPKKHKPGTWLRVYGKITVNKYDNELNLQPFSIQLAKRSARRDTAPEKRVELHLHTKMSAMDALTDTAEAISQAAAWGHRAIAITDHGVTHSFTTALANSKTVVAGTDEPIKILYGCEGYFINDVDLPLSHEGERGFRTCVFGDADAPLDGEFIALDVEATGLSPERDRLIEIGAARMKGDQILALFSEGLFHFGFQLLHALFCLLAHPALARAAGDDPVEPHGVVPEITADVFKGIVFCGIDPDVVVLLAQIMQQGRDPAADALPVPAAEREGQPLLRRLILPAEDDLVQIQGHALIVLGLADHLLNVRLLCEIDDGDGERVIVDLYCRAPAVMAV